MITTQLSQVFQLAALGWRIYPVSRPDYHGPDPGKSPWVEHGFHSAVADVAQIIVWCDSKPGCNWGVCPCNGIAVLDADAKHGGLSLLAQLERQHGHLPPTPCVETGGGGRHYYFAVPKDFTAKAKLGNDGLELISGKGGVIVPPSVHVSGKAYQWIVAPWDQALADAPAWLLALATPMPKTPSPEGVSEGVSHSDGNSIETLTWGGASDFQTLGDVPPGARNATLCHVIGSMLGRGVNPDDVLDAGFAWAEAHDYDPAELKRKVESIARAEALQQNHPLLGEAADASQGVSQGRELTNSAAPAVELVSSLPTLQPEAMQGLPGEIVSAIAPETEADPMAVLLCLLIAIGNAIGRTAHVSIGARKHYANLFVGLCGRSSSRKGEAWEIVRRLFALADADWAEHCIAGGFGSGEGLAWRLRDDSLKEIPEKRDGSVVGFKNVIVPGASEKRAIFVESEFSKVITLSRSEKSTLSEMLRRAWDGDALEYANKGDNAYKATQHHISIVAQITPAALGKALAQGKGTESHDGTFARFLWACVSRSKSLPFGGSVAVADCYMDRLRQAIARARAMGEVKLAPDAQELWREHYDRLATLETPCTEKACPQVIRLALVYALAEPSLPSGSDGIKREHLAAALAVWAYAEASASLLFNNKKLSLEAAADPLWLKLLKAIADMPGCSRSMIRDVAGHKSPASDITSALMHLQTHGMAHCVRVQPEGGGKPAEHWFPGVSKGRELTNSPPGSAPELAPPELAPQSGEGTNSPAPATATELVSSLPVAPAKASPTLEGMGFVVKLTEAEYQQLSLREQSLAVACIKDGRTHYLLRESDRDGEQDKPITEAEFIAELQSM